MAEAELRVYHPSHHTVTAVGSGPLSEDGIFNLQWAFKVCFVVLCYTYSYLNTSVYSF
jgi:hypothetical protein